MTVRANKFAFSDFCLQALPAAGSGAGRSYVEFLFAANVIEVHTHRRIALPAVCARSSLRRVYVLSYSLSSSRRLCSASSFPDAANSVAAAALHSILADVLVATDATLIKVSVSAVGVLVKRAKWLCFATSIAALHQ
jgi:hypothetical protein